MVLICFPDWVSGQDDGPPKISMAVTRSKKKKADDGGSGDFDDKSQKIRLLINITNNDFREFKNLKCRVTLVGEVMDDVLKNKKDEVFIVLDRQEMPFNLEQAKNVELETKLISVRFDESNFARFGARYLGFVVCLYDEKENRILGDTDKPRLLSNFDTVEALKVLAPFGSKLEPRSDVAHSVTVK